MPVICQHCGAAAPDDRVMCPNCRRRLRPAGGEAAAAPERQPAGVVAPEPAAAPEPAPAAAPTTPSPWATPPAAAAPEPPRPQVLFARDVITKSTRLTVAFRIILAIPQLLVLYALNIALEVMGLIGWFAALFTKRLPDGVHEFIANIVVYQLRVYAYVSLLTDRYPPFAFSDTDYDVQYKTSQETLNRLAVFFRIVLAIPAFLLLGLVVLGYAVVLVVTWFIVLIIGRMPEPLFDASAGVLRYSARVTSYFWLVSPAYPAGLFNDTHETTTDVFGGSAVAPRAARLEPPRQMAAAKRLLVVFVVIGAMAFGGVIAGVAVASAKQLHALNDLRHAHNTLVVVVQPAACTDDPAAQTDCLRTQASMDAAAFRHFESTLQGLHFGDSTSEKQQLVRTTDSLVRAFDALALAQNVQQYNDLAASQHVQSQLSQWNSDYKALDDAVRHGG